MAKALVVSLFRDELLRPNVHIDKTVHFRKMDEAQAELRNLIDALLEV